MGPRKRDIKYNTRPFNVNKLLTPAVPVYRISFMPTHIAIGTGQAADPQEAAYQACLQAKNSR